MHSLNEVFVLGIGMHPATRREVGLRLEEMVFHTSRRALDHARVSRRQLDNVVLGASDELDGRPISSMLMTSPAGGYLTDEMRVTDSGASALCLGFARIRSGDFDVGMVASWCKTSKTDQEAVMRFRGDPFFVRPLGMGSDMADALFVQAVAAHYGITEGEANRRAHMATVRATDNPRGLQSPPLSSDAIGATGFKATPLREGQVAPLSDGAVSIVIASARFLRSNPQCKPLAIMTGAGWASDSYRLDAERLGSMNSAKTAWSMALGQAGLSSASDFDAIELETPTAWHEAAYVRAFGIANEEAVSPSGGSFAQNPIFCSGLVNAAEAILQVAGQAGPVQRAKVRRAAAHGCHGYAQQGNVVTLFEQVGAGS